MIEVEEIDSDDQETVKDDSLFQMETELQNAEEGLPGALWKPTYSSTCGYSAISKQTHVSGDVNDCPVMFKLW